MNDVKIKCGGSEGFCAKFVPDVFGNDETLANEIKSATGAEKPRVMLVADANVVNQTEGLGMKIGRYVKAHGIELAGPPVVLGGGEKLKSDRWQSVGRLLQSAIDAKIGVNDVMLAMGGGAMLDVAGYVAAQVRGGVKLVRMPTTPASMASGALADSACINSINVKDAAKVKSIPSVVIIDTQFAKTVLPGVYNAGFGEILRMGVANDKKLFDAVAGNLSAIANRDIDFLDEIVRKAAAVFAKRGENGFALWGAARLQTMSLYKLPYGYAIPMGVCIDASYAVEKGYLKKADLDKILEPFQIIGTLEGFMHSGHIISNTASVLRGLDSWRLATGSDAIAVLNKIGSCQIEENPDREALEKVLKDMTKICASI